MSLSPSLPLAPSTCASRFAASRSLSHLSLARCSDLCEPFAEALGQVHGRARQLPLPLHLRQPEVRIVERDVVVPANHNLVRVRKLRHELAEALHLPLRSLHLQHPSVPASEPMRGGRAGNTGCEAGADRDVSAVDQHVRVWNHRPLLARQYGFLVLAITQRADRHPHLASCSASCWSASCVACGLWGCDGLGWRGHNCLAIPGQEHDRDHRHKLSRVHLS
eukprot:32465-Rhodomonas_salina.1